MGGRGRGRGMSLSSALRLGAAPKASGKLRCRTAWDEHGLQVRKRDSRVSIITLQTIVLHPSVLQTTSWARMSCLDNQAMPACNANRSGHAWE